MQGSAWAVTVAFVFFACQAKTNAAGDGEGANGTSGGAPTNIPTKCVADELDGTTQATSLFDVKAGLKKSVSVTFSGGQLQSFDGLACKPHPLEVPPEYPGCNQGWDCGPCFCGITVPGFGRNMWSLKCSDPTSQWQQCAEYQYVSYEVRPYVEPAASSSSGSSGGTSGGTTSCGSCKSCYENCNDSCDGYSGSCSTTCMKNCDRCCKVGG